MDVDANILPALRCVLDESGNALRVSSWLRGQDYDWRKSSHEYSLIAMRSKYNSDWISVDGIKFYVDGALGSHGAWLSEPYADTPETSGLVLLNQQDLQSRVDAAVEDGYAVAVHAIGDAAVHCALNVFEQVRHSNTEVVLRIEHAQVIHPSDIPRFAALNVIASVQPLMRVSDEPWMCSRLGERTAWTFSFRALLDSGARLIGGSDFPIEEPDCEAGMLAATGGSSQQQLTMEDARRLFRRTD